MEKIKELMIKNIQKNIYDLNLRISKVFMKFKNMLKIIKD